MYHSQVLIWQGKKGSNPRPTAKKAVGEYGSTVKAVSSIDGQMDVLENGSDASIANKKAVVAQMKANSAAWWNSNDAERTRLSTLNQTLGTSLGARIDGDGVWWLDNKRLYDIYHSGTPAAGQLPTPKQNELWALIEKGESVLTEKQQSGLHSLLKNFIPKLNLPDKFSSLMSSDISHINKSVISHPYVDASVKVYGYVDDQVLSIIEKNQQRIAEQVSKVFAKA